MPVGIKWPVLNKCTRKFHQLERVMDSLARVCSVASIDRWKVFVMVAYVICAVPFFCVDVTVTKLTVYLFEHTWMFLWIVN